ncbi:DUF4386 family protein [Phycicoccus sp. Soil802]|uniref:DUF4386 family protein n=1 Tax=Phycicoccus sp. Soil802 TaxID=1736414 RepID=UPI000A80F762|nr:DUF4386 family protein [Phycicoccus sp. Soil802]
MSLQSAPSLPSVPAAGPSSGPSSPRPVASAVDSDLVAVPRRRTAVLVVAATVMLNAAFTVLGSVLGYPDVLAEPAADVLALVDAHRTQVVTWFALLTAGALLIAPIALGLAPAVDLRWRRASVVLGVAAAIAQAIGLSRWVWLVPFLADHPTADDEQTYRLAATVLGTGLGETTGYLLTAAWTVTLCLGARALLPAALRWAGVACAAAIAVGALVPLDVPGADTVNFIGYVAWSVWLLVLAGRILWLRRGRIA